MLLRIGLIMTAGFLVIRATNVYGDPAPWSAQSSPLFTVLSFLRCTKYPVSLDFVLMTLGPALLLTAWLDRFNFGPRNPLMVFGRVPLFYFLVHLALIHLGAGLLDQALTGRTFLWTHPPPGMGLTKFAPYGYPLWVCYAVWGAIVALLYPACRWYGELKRRRSDWWLSYL
jgi:hypothetical protein